MEDKLKRYEKIEFLGEGQVVNVLYALLNIFANNCFEPVDSWLREITVVYMSDNMGTLILK